MGDPLRKMMEHHQWRYQINLQHTIDLTDWNQMTGPNVQSSQAMMTNLSSRWYTGWTVHGWTWWIWMTFILISKYILNRCQTTSQEWTCLSACSLSHRFEIGHYLHWSLQIHILVQGPKQTNVVDGMSTNRHQHHEIRYKSSNEKIPDVLYNL